MDGVLRSLQTIALCFAFLVVQSMAPRLVPGALENLKLTWPQDFALAERLLETR